MKTIIAGGRDYLFTFKDIRFLGAIKHSISEVVSGGCPTGADECGKIWAESKGIPVKVFKPDWDKYGKKAGPIRNTEMATYADAVILFPGGKGTESMKQEALKAGLAVFTI